MFVFGEVQDPTTETVNLVEDIVRGQIIELVRTPLHSLGPLVTPIHRPHHPTTLHHAQIVQARNLASRRGARYLSAEDLIFLIRHDRAKVNRLRTYLSWKDVRRHAKDSGGDGAAGMEVETLEDGADGGFSSMASFVFPMLKQCLLQTS
jgi:transcription initiation protein SPT3